MWDGGGGGKERVILAGCWRSWLLEEGAARDACSSSVKNFLFTAITRSMLRNTASKSAHSTAGILRHAMHS